MLDLSVAPFSQPAFSLLPKDVRFFDTYTVRPDSLSHFVFVPLQPPLVFLSRFKRLNPRFQRLNPALGAANILVVSNFLSLLNTSLTKKCLPILSSLHVRPGLIRSPPPHVSCNHVYWPLLQELQGLGIEEAFRLEDIMEPLDVFTFAFRSWADQL